jgi:hypothetical protein
MCNTGRSTGHRELLGCRERKSDDGTGGPNLSIKQSTDTHLISSRYTGPFLWPMDEEFMKNKNAYLAAEVGLQL